MSRELLPSQTLKDICPGLTDEIEMFIQTNPGFKGQEEAFVYALGQVAQQVIDKLDLEDVDKGLVINTMIKGFILNNAKELAAFNERIQALMDGESSTKH